MAQISTEPKENVTAPKELKSYFAEINVLKLNIVSPV